MVVGAFHIIEAQVVIPHGGSGIVQLDPTSPFSLLRLTGRKLSSVSWFKVLFNASQFAKKKTQNSMVLGKVLSHYLSTKLE